MQLWDATCTAMLSGAARRGAMIATLRCDHPDIRGFVDAKRDPRLLRHFNLSVQVTDDFIEAVDADADWPLVFPAHRLDTAPGEVGPRIQRAWPGETGAVACRVMGSVPARRLWERIVRAAYDAAEPGVLFIDRINRQEEKRGR
jgi:ribonucleoside-diphosphate reductase alpha chain